MKKSLLLVMILTLSCTIYAQKNLDNLQYAEIDSLVYLQYQKGEYAKAIPFLETGIKKAQAEFGEQDSTYAEYVGNLAVFCYLSGQYQKAEPLYLEAKKIRENTVGKEHPLYATAINNLAMLYRNMGDYAKAEPLMLETKEIDAKAFGKEHPRYAIDLNNLGQVYQAMGSYEQAEPLLLEAANIKEKALGKEHPLYARNLNNLATLYQEMEQFDKAEPLLLESISIKEKTLGKEHPDYATSIHNLAMLYQNTGKFEKAIPFLLEAIKTKAKLLGKEHTSYAASLNNLGLSYKKLGRYAESEALYLESMSVEFKVMGNENPTYAKSLFVLASLYLEMGKLDTAFSYCARSFDANSAQIDSNFRDFENLDKYDYYSNQITEEAIHIFLSIVQEQYEASGDKATLEFYYNLNKTAMRLNEHIRNNFSNEGDKLKILRDNGKFVRRGIEAALMLKKEGLKKEAFTFAEQNKSILLADALKGNRARTLGDLPDSLVEKEISLQKKMASLKQQQLTAKSEETKNQLNQSMSTLNIEINAFLKSIKDKYPKYHHLKYENITAKAEEIQAALDDETALLEYFLSDSISYLFLVTSKEVQLYPIPIKGGDLRKRIKALRFALTEYNMIVKKEDQAYSLYTQEAYWFYKNLLSFAIDKKGFKNLVIISDGELGHLPFEAFLVEPAEQKETIKYDELHYLVRDYNISYNYSATLFVEAVRSHGRKEGKSITNKQNNGQMLACAAAYEGVDSSLMNIRLPYFYRLRSLLKPLPEAQNEIKSLSETFEGDFLLNNSTNERFFKEQASNYSVVHLAMHGILDPRSPMLSSLVFSENKDSLEDNFLQAFEIARLDLKADLVVLSACETGYGKFEQGEGVVSLARSFMYAGVPSLVVSLWQVNDASTSMIMQSFYENLANGMNKAEALRKAKLNYLQRATGVAAHPAFWSPFIQLGDSKAIYLKTKGTWLPWIIAATALLLLVGFLVVRRRKEVA